ncbi:Lecithin-cholesterol acyltransferase-like 1 [Forsythia ovata]|uniref:Lecithin-cholesterol acyltransferase-like 1 n=1 Tax=Forsythia ovata TaxID=205694 RepID=A0ABD1UWR7_9LAMI
MPSPEVFNTTKPLVITPNASYSANDIAQFLEDIGFPQGVKPYKSRILPLVEKLVAPEVPITCIIGTGIKTPGTLFYGECGFDKRPEVVYDNGDGTVNMVSLLAVENAWANDKSQSLKVIKLPGVSHTSILKDDLALDEIIGEICSINSQFSSY